MEKIIHAMMDLIASEVCGKSIDKSQYTLTDEELVKLYKLLKSHDLAHLVGDALIKNNLIGDSEVKAKFQKQRMLAVYRYEKINHELGRLRKVLNEAKIPFIPLKGSVLRRYYPEPWMRTSCDIDILIHESDLERAVAMLVDKLAYKREFKGSHDISLFSDYGVHLELHYSLIEENCVGNIESVLQDVWKKADPVAETFEYVLSDEMFYYYHIAHMAKHFVYGGCGVRPFLDLWVLNHRAPFDQDNRSAILAEGGLLTFTSEAKALSEVWFGNTEHTDITRQMQNYLLKGGVYGTTKNRVSVQQVKHGGKFRYAISRIWLPYDTLKFHYPSLVGKRALLPLYEVRRWCKLIFCGGAKRGMNELKLNSAVSATEQDQINEMLSALGIRH
jgi:hypothetical protein